MVLADFSQAVGARNLSPSVKLLAQTYAEFQQQVIHVVGRLQRRSARSAGGPRADGSVRVTVAHCQGANSGGQQYC